MTVPATIRICELAITAGRLGRPISLCLQGYATPLLGATWRSIASSLGAVESVFVETRSDFKDVVKRLGLVRAVFIRKPSLFVEAGWASATTWARSTGSKPCLLAGEDCGAVGEYPEPRLVLHADDTEVEALTAWLGSTASLSIPKPHTLPVMGAAMKSALDERLPFDERPIVEALLVAACATRIAKATTHDDEAPLISLDDYQLVRDLLQHPAVRGAIREPERLAVDMVDRANVYIGVRFGPDRSDHNPFASEARFRSPTTRNGAPIPITRREIADLGNVRSRLVRDIVEYLLAAEDGRERFRRMGLKTSSPTATRWQLASVDQLIGLLRRWSAKQVRTNFDRLRREGLITAERTTGNGPWEYRLPEELAHVSTPFGALPTVEELQAGDPEIAAD